jgi:Zn finger protein HypA/HybF involved in hydrogenase expression
MSRGKALAAEKKLYYDVSMPIPRQMVCDCRRCGHTWVKRIEGRPLRCPKCKDRHWDVAVGVLKVGRPKKKAAKKKGKK